MTSYVRHSGRCDYVARPNDPDAECYCTDESGAFMSCGHLEVHRCSEGCGCCLVCEGCYCGED